MQLSYEKAAARKCVWITREPNLQVQNCQPRRKRAERRLQPEHSPRQPGVRQLPYIKAFICLVQPPSLNENTHLQICVQRTRAELAEELFWVLQWDVFCANQLRETRQTGLDDRSSKHWRLECWRDDRALPSALLTALEVQTACLLGNNAVCNWVYLDGKTPCSLLGDYLKRHPRIWSIGVEWGKAIPERFQTDKALLTGMSFPWH